MIKAFGNAFKTPELRKKILFTLFILAVFRLGSAIPTPNVNLQRINECRMQAMEGDTSGMYSMLNLFSGGALLQLAIFALGIMPYITASIILQLMTVVVPRLETLKKEGASGQAKITEYTRYLTLVLAVLNATAFVTMATNGMLFRECQANGPIVYNTGIFATLVMIAVMTAGTGLIMWLGELITERGIGNGMSVLIFTQIVAQFPASLWGIKTMHASGKDQGWILFTIVLAIGLMVMAGVIFMEQGQRRIPVQYAKRMVGKRVVGGTTTYIPLKVNQSGVIPVIFASSILQIPIMVAQFNPEHPFGQWVNRYFNPSGDNSLWYNVFYFVLIIAMCYFYVAITFNPEEISDNMKKYGGFIPGVRAGKATERYLSHVLSRLTAPGSLYLALISLIPTVAFILVGASGKFPFGGTSILIVVGVGLDTIKRIESQLQQRHYEGFLK